MACKARVLYDFDGVPENNELTIKEGQTVTVIGQDVGDGWWEGKLPNGNTGLFPESYVEVIDSNGTANNEYGNMQPYNQTNTDGYNAQPQGGGYDEDPPDWEEWDEDGGQVTSPTNVTGGATSYGRYQSDRTSSREPGDSTLTGSQSGDGTRQSKTVRRNINRFSDFVKTGTESFILGNTGRKGAISPVPEKEKIRVVYSNEGQPMWEPNPRPYQVEVRDPEKKSKFKGIKSFIAYTIIPDDTRNPVQRRYKHYDWLHDRLLHKFTVMSVPPLPDKQYYGRYGEDFIEKRKEKLQMWTNRLARHPIISRSEVFRHFLTCEDDAQWKAGKRRAEKDEVAGGALLMCIEHPEIHVELDDAEGRIDNFDHFHTTLTDSCMKMKEKFEDHCTKMSGPFMREFHRMAGVFRTMSDCFAAETEPYAKGVNQAMQFTGEVYEQIADLYTEQPKHDMIPALDILKEYLGLLEEFPDTQHLAKKSTGKVREGEKLDGVIDFTELADIRSRAETVNTALLAEIHHFQHERVVDFKLMMQNLLTSQITFYQNIVQKLQGSLSKYDE